MTSQNRHKLASAKAATGGSNMCDIRFIYLSVYMQIMPKCINWDELCDQFNPSFVHHLVSKGLHQ